VKAARCLAHGPPGDVRVVDVALPELQPGHALVRVMAASVNFADVLIVTGAYQVQADVPFTPGSEFAGEVIATAPDVSNVRSGDRVMGVVFVGAFAEEVVASAASLIELPNSVDWRDAAAVGVAHATAYHALHSVAGMRPGEWVAVLGAGGGVGLAAVELAHHFGGHVVAAASSAEKLEAGRAKGAEALVNYQNEDLTERLRALTDGGVDVVIDPVGGRYSQAALRATKWAGRFVCVGFASGEIPRIALNLVLLKGVTVQGFEFRGFAFHSPDEVRRGSQELLALLAGGGLHPHVSAVYPLSEAGAAMRSVAERRSIGKVLIDPTA
jgi:NADPH2:quinone reductase